MKIAIDIDNTIINSEKAWIKINAYCLHQCGVEVNESVSNHKQLFPDNLDEITYKKVKKLRKKVNKNFINDYKVFCYAKQIIDKLKSLGFEIYIVSARRFKDWGMRLYTLTKMILKNNGINYDKLYCNVINKAKFCKKHDIELIIDDSIENCKSCAKLNIFAICFNCDCKNISNKIKISNNWNDVYKVVLDILK